MRQAIVGIDIGGTNIRMGLVDTQTGIVDMLLKSSQALAQEDPVGVLTRMVGDYCKRHEGYKIEAISIGIPATVRIDGKAATSTPNLQSLDNVDLVSPLRKSFFCPVYLNRDANLLLLCAMQEEKIPHDSMTIGIFYGTGVGNAIWNYGSLLLGKNGMAGELGHIPLWRNKMVCACGNEGCAETAVSGRYFEAMCKKEFPGTKIGQVFTAHWPHPLLEEYVHDLAIPAATEINLLDPDYVFIGGGIVYMENFPKERLLENIKQSIRRPYPLGNIDIRYVPCEQEAGILGAAWYAMNKLKENEDEAKADDA